MGDAVEQAADTLLGIEASRASRAWQDLENWGARIESGTDVPTLLIVRILT